MDVVSRIDTTLLSVKPCDVGIILIEDEGFCITRADRATNDKWVREPVIEVDV